MSLKKTGAEALDELVLSMTSSPVDRIHRLIDEGRAKEASSLVNQLSLAEIEKLAQDLDVQVSQDEDEASPPAKTVSSEHDKEPNTSKGKPHAGEPADEEAEINEVEGEGGSEKKTRAPDQIEEESPKPGDSKSEKKEAQEGKEKKEDKKDDSDSTPKEEKPKEKSEGEKSEEEKVEEEKTAKLKKRIVQAYIAGAQFRTNQIKANLMKKGGE